LHKAPEATTTLKDEEVLMLDQTAQAKIPQQWNIKPTVDNQAVFDCPACQKHFSFEASTFLKDPTEQIEHLKKTDRSVSRAFGQNIIPLVLALIVYYYAHQWINGKDTPLNQGILIPVFIAVLAHAIFKPVFSAGIFGLKGIPIYNYKCSQCNADIFFACDGKSLALPIAPGTKDGAPSAAIKSAPLETPCNVSITRLPSMLGAAMGVEVFLNGAEMGILQNGKTLDFTTDNSFNELTVKYRADGATNSVTFNAESGGSVRISLKYSGAVLSVT
jgi:hypothetical protein